MKKLRMKCHSAEIIFATNSEKIYNYFLTDEEQVPETIPGIEIIPDQNVGLDGNYLIYLDKSGAATHVPAEHADGFRLQEGHLGGIHPLQRSSHAVYEVDA